MDIPQLLWESVPTWATASFVALNVLVGVIAAGVVPHNRHPGSSWGWLLIIIAFPVLGLLAYLVVGRARMPEDRRKKQRRAGSLVSHDGAGASPDQAAAAPQWVRDAVRLNEHNGGFTAVGGNRVEILDDYDGSLAAMAEQIRGAVSFVHFQFYIAVADSTTEPVVAALEDAHRRGVRVRVLIDHLGSVGFPGYKELVRRLDTAGVPWRRMLPVRPWRGEYQRPDLRNHRKILVVDGRVGFTGSQNVIDRSYNKKSNLRDHLQWIGLMLRVEGPVVGHLDALFATDWWCETGELERETAEADLGAVRGPGSRRGGTPCQLLPSGPGQEQESSLQLFTQLFAGAAERITVCTPYFVPDESMYVALQTAARRGVEVRLYMGRTSNHAVTHHAQRSFYEQTLGAGIRIFLYRAPFVLHAKFVLVDDEVAVVGSSNMDIRSLVLDLEVNLMVLGADFVTRMDHVVEGYHRASHELDHSTWLARPRHEKYLDNVARLTSALQ